MVPMQAQCTKAVTKSDGSGGTKRGGERVGVGNGVDAVNRDGLEREMQESNGDRSGNGDWSGNVIGNGNSDEDKAGGKI